jgi:tetratricopeptide (TPR) repeat protein
MSNLSAQQAQAVLQEALALHRQGQLAAADAAYTRILQNSSDPLHLLGIVKLQTGKAEEALHLITAALTITPHPRNEPDLHANLGLAYVALKRPAEALASFERALALNPDHVDALANRGTALLDLGRVQDALDSVGQALARDANHVSALFNRGTALSRAGRAAEALADFDRVLTLWPQHAEALGNRGHALQALGRHEDALTSYTQAISLRQDYVHAHFNQALALLALGDYARGFAAYEWRWKFGAPDRSFDQPLWRGDYPLANKTILLHNEQGLGDTIQFARYAPLLARDGAKVLLEVQGELKALLSSLPDVTVQARGETLPAFDLHCPLGSLPLAFKTTLHNVPAPIPYLRASAAHIAKWRPRLDALPPGLRVALAWAGNPAHVNDRNRSIALARLTPLIETPGVRVISVQRDVPTADRAALAQPRLLHLGDELTDFEDTAAILALCDRVITVDSAVAHLAGAMGRDTFVLLPFWPDWRWTLTGAASPWYPHARLFRQGADGDWDPVIARVRAEIGASS